MAINYLSVKIISPFFQYYNLLVLDPRQLLGNKQWVCTSGVQSHVLWRDLRPGLSLKKSKIENNPIQNHSNWQGSNLCNCESLDFHCHPMTMTQSPSFEEFKCGCVCGGKGREGRRKCLLWVPEPLRSRSRRPEPSQGSVSCCPDDLEQVSTVGITIQRQK